MIAQLEYTERGWAMWPATMPRPTVADIRNTTARVLGVPSPEWEKPPRLSRNLSECRALAGLVCRVVLNHSYPEAAGAVGYNAHSALLDPACKCQQYANSEGGRVLYNAVVERMYLDKEGSYQDAARKSLSGHAGGVA